MNLQRVRIRIRQRDVLDVRDLAFALLRTQWLGLGLAWLVGFVPVSLLMLGLRSLVYDAYEPMPYILLYWMGTFVLLPFATATMTLYLGGWTFAAPLKVGRIARDFVVSLPSMLLVHGMLRGLCAMCFLLVPLPVLGFRYANEIILLERDRMTRAWSRGASFHGHFFGPILLETLLDIVLGTIMYLLLATSLRVLQDLTAAASEPIWYEPTPEQAGNFLLPTHSWTAHLSLWLVFGYFAVVRYLSYLDCRIRREGWEVELQLRAEGAKLVSEDSESW